jgi:hypothetical protein
VRAPIRPSCLKSSSQTPMTNAEKMMGTEISNSSRTKILPAGSVR